MCFAAIGLYFSLNDRPQTLGLPSVADWNNDHGIPIEKQAGKDQSTSKMQFMILKQPSIWILGIAGAMMSATRYAINSWGILYLQEAKEYTLVEAGSILGLNTLAGKIKIIGFDAVDEARKEIRSKRIEASVAQHPEEMGRLAIENSIKVLNGDTISNYIPVKIELITLDNVDDSIH